MNYRHAFHAGNFADVAKHVALTLVIEHLKRKDKPFRVIDTHAGLGGYRLDGFHAQRTGEWRRGIGPILDAVQMAAAPNRSVALEAPAAIRAFADLVAAHRAVHGPATYPGSPALAAMMLRTDDRLHANELHPDDAQALAAFFARDRRVVVTGLEGWQIVRAALPPKERRGVVLIDPPFEQPGEFQRLVSALADANRRFATGVGLLWYPVKEPTQIERFHRDLAQSGVPDLTAVEVHLSEPAPEGRMAGSGLVLWNPPYRMIDTYSDALLWCAHVWRSTVQPALKIIPLTDDAGASCSICGSSSGPRPAAPGHGTAKTRQSRR
ncbi:MAG: 23S rRNA (adenine(2030)-N(6))-methyltransferase RlmJ [Hyphomicrobiaceae bacterium]